MIFGERDGPGSPQHAAVHGHDEWHHAADHDGFFEGIGDMIFGERDGRGSPQYDEVHEEYLDDMDHDHDIDDSHHCAHLEDELKHRGIKISKHFDVTPVAPGIAAMDHHEGDECRHDYDMCGGGGFWYTLPGLPDAGACQRYNQVDESCGFFGEDGANHAAVMDRACDPTVHRDGVSLYCMHDSSPRDARCMPCCTEGDCEGKYGPDAMPMPMCHDSRSDGHTPLAPCAGGAAAIDPRETQYLEEQVTVGGELCITMAGSVSADATATATDTERREAKVEGGDAKVAAATDARTSGDVTVQAGDVTVKIPDTSADAKASATGTATATAEAPIKEHCISAADAQAHFGVESNVVHHSEICDINGMVAEWASDIATGKASDAAHEDAEHKAEHMAEDEASHRAGEQAAEKAEQKAEEMHDETSADVREGQTSGDATQGGPAAAAAGTDSEAEKARDMAQEAQRLNDEAGKPPQRVEPAMPAGEPKPTPAGPKQSSADIDPVVGNGV